MATLLNVGIKQDDGTWKNVTIAINDKTNEWGKNVSVWEQQTKEEREAKTPKNYCGNGLVFWTDGKVTKAEYQAVPTTEAETKDDLPF